MTRTVKAHYKQDNTLHSISLEVPDVCPTCSRLVDFAFVSSTLCLVTKELQGIFKCPSRYCLSFITCYYDEYSNSWKLKHTEPPALTNWNFPGFVAEISTSFVSIFKEAVEARERGLAQIAGPGYRKAFEFLIKDYAKSKSPADANAIENSHAAQVVKNYLTDTRVQAVAKRALWIGNDETHYLRKWVDQEITDLETLIRLTIEWIDIERQSAAYIDEMPD